MSNSVSLLNYSDYRDYLKDWFWSSKSHNAKISFRFISRLLGLKAPNHFHLVVTKRRHLSKITIEKVAQLLKLGAREKQYFRLLVQHDLEKSLMKRKELAGKIELLRRQVLHEEQSADKLRIVGNRLAWYIKMGAIVFEGKSLEQLQTLVKSSCTFPVDDAEIANALQILMETGSLRFDDGRSVFDNESIATKWDLDRSEIKQHHLANLKYAMESVAWPIERRFLNSVTITCDEALYQAVIADIRSLSLSILERSDRNMVEKGDASKLVTLQMALFPFFDFKSA